MSIFKEIFRFLYFFWGRARFGISGTSAIEDRNFQYNTTNVVGTNPNTANPQFVNPGAENWRLQSGSPAIDYGNTADPTYNFDIEYKLRPLGAGWDCGVYEDF